MGRHAIGPRHAPIPTPSPRCDDCGRTAPGFYRWARRRLCGRLTAAGGEIGAGAKVPAAAAQHDDAHGVVGAQCLELIGKLIKHCLVEGVAAIGPIERDGCDASG